MGKSAEMLFYFHIGYVQACVFDDFAYLIPKMYSSLTFNQKKNETEMTKKDDGNHPNQIAV